MKSKKILTACFRNNYTCTDRRGDGTFIRQFTSTSDQHRLETVATVFLSLGSLADREAAKATGTGGSRHA